MRLELARELKTDLIQLARRAVQAAAEDVEDERDVVVATPQIAVGVLVRRDGSFGVALRYAAESAPIRTVVDRAMGLAGADCDVREVGRIEAQRWEPSQLQQRVRPLRPGLSVAHVDVTAGTLGAFVTPDDASANSAHMLSNNHVLADADRGRPGDVVVQPGPADGGVTSDDRVGVLDRVVALRPDAPNLVDAATAVLDDDVAIEPAHPAGALAGVAEVDADATVEKVGRTTGVTRGRVSAIELDGVSVEYPVGVVTFDDQIEVTGDGAAGFSSGGDSGSAVYRPDTREAVGLLFAGSERGGPDGQGLTYCNPFAVVLTELRVRLVTS